MISQPCVSKWLTRAVNQMEGEGAVVPGVPGSVSDYTESDRKT